MKITHRNPNQTARRTQRAFTLVEMLLVVVILGILASIVLPSVVHRSEDAKIAAAKTQISTFETALGAYEVDNQSFPRGRDGLQALMVRPRDAQS